MGVVCRLLLLASAGLLGVFAGAMLTEGGVLVPFWRDLPPEAFFAWYAANDQRLLDFFAPLTTAAALVALAAAIASLVARHPGRWAALLAALLALAAVATFFLYFEAANARFSAASIPPGELGGELARWAAWHHARTALAVAALVAALQALRAPRASH